MEDSIGISTKFGKLSKAPVQGMAGVQAFLVPPGLKVIEQLFSRLVGSWFIPSGPFGHIFKYHRNPFFSAEAAPLNRLK